VYDPNYRDMYSIQSNVQLEQALACFMRERANQGMPVSCFGEDE
jgi:hypothetical protein